MKPFPIFHGPYEVMLATENGSVYRSDGTQVETYINVDGYKTFGKNVGGYEVKKAVHRAVWEAFNGPVPNGMVIDHINQDKLDNRLSNLRLTTKSGNSHNTNRRGIHRVGARWRAITKVKGKNIHIGYYETEDEAVQAKRSWRDAKIKHEELEAIRAAGVEVTP